MILDMQQIYVQFSLKTRMHVQYFDFSGHAGKTCSLFISPNAL